MGKYRRSATVDLAPLWLTKGHIKYIEVYKNLGISEPICECAIDYPDRWTDSIPKRVRAKSGTVGLRECTICDCLVWPICAIYECDECLEYALADHYPVTLEEEFLCDDCI